MATNATTTAAQLLRQLLALPDQRPGCWEAAHVIALEDELQAIRDVLEGVEAEQAEADGALEDLSTKPERTP